MEIRGWLLRWRAAAVCSRSVVQTERATHFERYGWMRIRAEFVFVAESLGVFSERFKRTPEGLGTDWVPHGFCSGGEQAYADNALGVLPR